MIPSACNLYVHPLIDILCKGTCKICFTGANTGTYNLMKENAFSSDFLQNVHLLLTTILLVITTELHKDLGVIMSNNLSWAEHLKFISSRAYKLLGRSRSRSHHPNIKKILYISHIRSQLTYCSQVWRPHLLYKAYYVP